MSAFQGRDVLSIRDLSRADIQLVLRAARKMVPIAVGEKRSRALEGKILSTIFYEPSTRTRLSFESAMARLGGRVLGFSSAEGTSVQKGETLADTSRMVEAYSDAIVLRHPQEGAARLAADFTEKPVINAGDGAGQHPTQTLQDLYTIWDERGSFEGQNVALVGDLKYGRTVHSLTYALAELGSHLIFVSPETLEMPREILEHVKERGLSFRVAHRLEDVIRDADGVYATRIQKTRFPDPRDRGRRRVERDRRDARPEPGDGLEGHRESGGPRTRLPRDRQDRADRAVRHGQCDPELQRGGEAAGDAPGSGRRDPALREPELHFQREGADRVRVPRPVEKPAAGRVQVLRPRARGHRRAHPLGEIAAKTQQPQAFPEAKSFGRGWL